MPSSPVLRTASILATAALIAAATLASAGNAQAHDACPARATCGTVTVPLDRADPSGATLAVAYAFVPRTDLTHASLGVVAPNPGGPGVSTIGQAELYSTLMAPLLTRRDLLLVDARGTGRSGAIRCAWPSPTTPLLETPSSLGGRCIAPLGKRATNYGSADVADDLDAIRASLGIDRLDLWGDSYGTFLMPVYAARHPQHVRSIVLDGAFPVAFDPWGRDVLAGTRRVLTLACRRARTCSGPTVLRQVARLARQLRRHPITVRIPTPAGSIQVTAGERDLAEVVHAAGDPQRLRWVPVAVDEALHGDRRRLRQLIIASRTSDAQGATVDPELFSLGAAAAVSCHDYPRAFSLAATPAERRLAYARALAALPSSSFAPFSADAWLSTDIDAGPKCIDWPVDPTAGSPLAGLTMPSVPVLVQSGDLDSNTPIEQGRAAAAQFPAATFAVSKNAGHTPDLQPCGVAQAIRFVERLHVDPESCRHAGRPPRIEPVDAQSRPRRNAAISRARPTGSS